MSHSGRPTLSLRRVARLLIPGVPLLCLGAAPPVLADEDDEAITLPTVHVVGSHIRRVEFETVHPVVVLQRAELARTGLSSLGEILQQLPLQASGLNTDSNNAGNGQTRVDLRNLGANRTLVLLNGRRYANSLDGAVDVASIPLPIVERVEVLTDGASAIYGSDAIAGVVNIVTRDEYRGMEASAYYATNEHGDGERRAADLTWGRDLWRGNLALNLSFTDQQPVWAGDRAITAVPLFGFPGNDHLANASRHGPNGLFFFGESGKEGGLTWDPALGDYRVFDPRRDGYNYAPENYLRTPYERIALFAQATQALGNDTTLRVDLLAHRRRSAQRLAPTPIVQFGAGGDPNHHTISADSLYNPFGEPITRFSFRPLDRPRRFELDVLTSYLTLSLEGSIAFGQRRFVWDAFATAARTDEDETIGGGYNLHRLGLAVGPSFHDASGTPRCGTPTAPIAGCVPVDFLHGNEGFTDAMFEYLAVPAARIEQTRRLADLGLSFSGGLFDLPAGPLALAAGLEHRRERGRVDLHPLLQDNAVDFGGPPGDEIDGETRIDEAYVEFEVPLLSRRPWAHELTLSLAARHSRYSSFGNTTNRKSGLSWRPASPLLWRATWSQGYRAPSTLELFGAEVAFQSSADTAKENDPCVGAVSGEVAARCAADGVPVGAFQPPIGPRLRFGSNAGLHPEQARNRSLGLVWSPPGIAGLDLSLDWWRIDLDDTIDDIEAPILLSQCYLQGLAGACRQLTRDPATGVLTEIDGRLHNYGRSEVEGYDFSLGYRWRGDRGEFALRWDSVYLARHDREIPKDAPPQSLPGNYFRFDPSWRLRSLLSLDWNRGEFGTTARLRYYSSLDESCFFPADAGDASVCDRPHFRSPTFGGEPENILGARSYVDLQLRWQPWRDTLVTLGVDNAFGQAPPVAYSASPRSYDPSYDIPGRFWYARVSQRFR